jgi:Ca2+-binding RTX toxin-like protein
MSETIGTLGDDVLSGDAGENTIIGKTGNDVLAGLDGDDDLNGGAGNDVLVGGRGSDTLAGRADNDTIIWNNGDGSDLIDGGSGADIQQVNGAVADGDEFRVDAGADGAAVFQRVNLIPFTLTMTNVETLDVRGLGGDDRFTVGDLSGTDIEQVVFRGGAGNDVLDASAATTPILASGESGDDTLTGGSSNDVLAGGSGADTLVFADAFGDDLVLDFRRGDTLEFAVAGVTGIGDLTIATDGGDTLITVEGSGSVRLEGFTRTLTDADFAFT